MLPLRNACVRIIMSDACPLPRVYIVRSVYAYVCKAKYVEMQSVKGMFFSFDILCVVRFQSYLIIFSDRSERTMAVDDLLR
jgi:hypothetical protein